MPIILRGFPYHGSTWAKTADPSEFSNPCMDRILVPVSITPPWTSWVQLRKEVKNERHRATSVFYALLDTGCNYNFSIREEDLERYTGLTKEQLGIKHGDFPINDKKTIPFIDATLWIHYNASLGSAEVSKKKPFQVELTGGIGIYPRGRARKTQLPLIGLQALDDANLKVHIDCERGFLTLGT